MTVLHFFEIVPKLCVGEFVVFEQPSDWLGLIILYVRRAKSDRIAIAATKVCSAPARSASTVALSNLPVPP